MKKTLFALVVAMMAAIAGNAADSFTLELCSASISGKFSDNISPSLFSPDGTKLTIVKDNGSEIDVVVSIPLEAGDPVQVKTINYMEAQFSYWDKDENSIDIDPIPFDMTQAGELISFLGTQQDENTRVKSFRFKGIIKKAQWEAFSKASSQFLNIMGTSFTLK